MSASALLTRLTFLAACVFGSTGPLAFAQSGLPRFPTDRPEMTERCPGLVAATDRKIVPVAARPGGLAPDEARISFIGHATFLIESPNLVRIATDFSDFLRLPRLPDVVTMNHAHATHYTDRPDPDIKFILRGWRDDGKPANHDVTYSDVHVRSVSTNIRDWNGGTERNGNAIFIFEVGSLCIAHLGHLHHTLTRQQLDDIGHVDVLLVPVDGGYTMDLEGMIEVIQAIKAPLMVPMHFFNTTTLRRFLERVGKQYELQFAETPSFVVSKATLPSRGKFLILPGH